MEITLNNEQQHLFELIENTTDNYCILGAPGVGKSVLINHLMQYGKKPYTLTAPTGLAALNINGHTLHKTFNIPVFEGLIPYDYLPKMSDRQFEINSRIASITHLIIDEISMVRIDVFEYINRLLKWAKKSEQDFGGVQLILLGDFYQLPPVCKPKELKELKEAGIETPFVFSSPLFSNFRVHVLREVMRQKGDTGFIDILHKARGGAIDMRTIKDLNTRVQRPEKVLQLVSTNKEAERINLTQLKLIEGQPTYYQAQVFGDWAADPFPRVLSLKVGAQIIVKKNGADFPPHPETGSARFETKLVNGTLGTVVELHTNRVVIDVSGELHNVYIQKQERKVRQWNDVAEEFEEKVVASFKQLPLDLAWAISIHKSQGQTFNAVHISSKRIFAPGQLYVALSRTRSLAGITLEEPIRSSQFFVDRRVIKFCKPFEE
jgi:ATP-dependent DNA helicase PIF1